MRITFVVGGGLGLVFFVSMLVLMLGEGSYPVFEIILGLSFFAALIFLSFCFIGVFAPLRGALLIQRQDKTLGRNFNEEMKKRKVSEFDFSDGDCFVSVKSDRIIAFYRGYIATIEDKREENRILSRIVVHSTCGRRHKVVGHFESIDHFQAWFKDESFKGEPEDLS